MCPGVICVKKQLNLTTASEKINSRNYAFDGKKGQLKCICKTEKLCFHQWGLHSPILGFHYTIMQ